MNTSIFNPRKIYSESFRPSSDSNILSGRGGCTICDIGSYVIIFGGANREQVHFSDTWTVEKSEIERIIHEDSSSSINIKLLETFGDIPSPRSGHSVSVFGNLLFLFGGINFTDESVFNDLYVFNIDNSEWKYVGEKGAIIKERNSQIMNIIDGGEDIGAYLVIYGGASPESGPLGETFYSKIPRNWEDIVKNGIDSFYVEWQILSIESPSPGPREMHGSAVVGNSLYIMGGRGEDGNMLNDIWGLSFNPIKDINEHSIFSWKRINCDDLHACCAHSLVAFGYSLFSFGGFDETVGISQQLYKIDLSNQTNTNIPMSSSPNPIPARFGHCACVVKLQLIDVNRHVMILFGGVNLEADLADMWLIILD